MWISEHFRVFSLLRRFNDALPDRFLTRLSSFFDQEHSAGDTRLRYRIRFDDSNPRRPADRSAVLRRLPDFLIGHVFRERDHAVGIGLSRIRAFSSVVLE